MGLSKKLNIYNIAFHLTLLTIFVKIISFVREIVISAYFGTSIYSDAYSFSFNIVNVIFLLVSTYLVTTFGPIYIKMKEEKGLSVSSFFAINVVNSIAIISIIVTLIGMVYSPTIIHLIAPSYHGEQLELNILILRVMFLLLPFMSIAAVYSSLLNAQNSYLGPQLIWLPGSIIIIIACIIFGENYGIVAVAVATVMGAILQIVIQLPWSRKYIKYKLFFNPKDKQLKLTYILAIPAFLGTLLGNISIIVDRYLISNLPIGSMAAIDFATKLTALITSLLLVPITTILFTKITEYIAKKSFDHVNSLLNQSIQLVSFVLLPILCISYIIPYDIVEVIYERRNFNSSATLLTGEAFKYLLFGVLFLGIFNIIANLFYSLQKTKIPMICGSVGVLFNILTSIILTKFMGLGGVALGTSIGFFVALISIIFALKREVKYIEIKKSIQQIIFMIICSFISGYLVDQILSLLLFEWVFIKIILAFIIGIIIYLVFSFLLRIDIFVKGCSSLIKYLNFSR